MNNDDQVRVLKQARIDLANAQRRVLHLQQVVDGLSGLLEPISTTGPVYLWQTKSTPTTHEMSSLIRPRDAVLSVLRANVGVPLTPRRVWQEVEAQGLMNPKISSGQAAYDTALRRLAEEPGTGVVRDEDNGTYTYRRSQASAPGSATRQGLRARASVGLDNAGRVGFPPGENRSKNDNQPT